MTNSDIQGAASAFKKVGADALALKASLDALGSQPISAALAQALQALAVLAKKGQGLLLSGTAKARTDEIDALTKEVAELDAQIVLGGDIDAINAKIASLTAQRANLLLEDVGDFSDIVSPAQVQSMLALAVQVHDAVEQKQKAAELIGIVEQLATAAVDVSGVVAAA